VITTNASENRPRRRFLFSLGGLAVAWIGAALYPVYRYLSPQPTPDPFDEHGRALVDKISPADVRAPGMGKNGAYGGRGLVMFRDADGKLKAFDAKCTHAGCNVSFQGERIYCHCHGGTYDLNGKNIAGPPPRPLTELRVVEEEGLIYVLRPETTNA
jgi:Rieske Fe-S protein